MNARSAEALGSHLPPLLVAAERVAATVAAGVHERRRTGTGDVFWQYRGFVHGDPVSRIDWRQTGKSDRATIRETEWEAAQTVCLWRDASASMRWRSADTLPPKRERAELLALALASLLLRGGERVRLIGRPGPPFTGRAALDRMAEMLADEPAHPPSLPPDTALPRHARAVLIGDFLAPLSEISTILHRLQAAGLGGQVMQVLDPAEAALPYDGRVRFRGMEDERDLVVPRAGALRDAYRDALAAHQAGLAALARASGFGCLCITPTTAEAGLLALYMALAPQ